MKIDDRILAYITVLFAPHMILRGMKEAVRATFPRRNARPARKSSSFKTIRRRSRAR